MSISERLKPKFWEDRDSKAGPFEHLFDFRRIWILAVTLPAVVALVPVISGGVFDYKVTKSSMGAEMRLRTSRLVSNTRRAVSFFLGERKSALDFVARHRPHDELVESTLLATVLNDLQKAFGGFTDLGVIDSEGVQKAYVGPFELQDKDYSRQEWFREVMMRGAYISDVFLGFRQAPHLVIAVRRDLPDSNSYVLRATIDTQQFDSLFSELEVSGRGDAFIVNRAGIIQTPTRHYGKVLEKMDLPVPKYSSKTQVFETKNVSGELLIVGYAYISETPFILMIVKYKAQLMGPWYKTRLQLVGFLAVSIAVILIVILGVATHLVNKIHVADEERLSTLHKVEHENKMASIGRLAAGVAHEINNPLEIINQQAGLMKDVLTFNEAYARDEKLMSVVDSILRSVERAGTVTKRLLSFARHMDMKSEPIDLEGTIGEVIGFLAKEAEYREIGVDLEVPDNIPKIVNDRGKLQQVLLNLVNNSFGAMSDGGHMGVKVSCSDEQTISITVTDDGCGIAEADIKRIFEPFFSTKKHKGGTGLGLSITHGLVREMGGTIEVRSEVGKGASFTVTLPLEKQVRKVDH